MSVIKPARKEISLCFSPPADGAGRQPTVTEELVRRERPISEEYLYYLARARVVSCVQLLQRHGPHIVKAMVFPVSHVQM